MSGERAVLGVRRADFPSVTGVTMTAPLLHPLRLAIPSAPTDPFPHE